ncbi:hydantoinase B/oxoprolinase family protein [Falsiroseomonas sp. HW251]|uniref:hydantoinase B/oxoprolinase family protein n=1 Tax=Falsiroseomonas sp. HW251 TaxID=3390998 RepID=UPI003D317D07
MSGRARWRIGFDIGGTFTDFILYDSAEGALRLHKRLTSVPDPSDAALAGLEELVSMAGIQLADVGELLHGTTLVTNAVIERRGAPLGLITTAGFRDVLEMGIEQRYDIYDLFLTFPDPMVPRARRIGVPERLDRDGQVLTPLDLDAVRAALTGFVKDGVQAVAVCFLHSYRNPAHEQAVAALIREEFPQIAVSLSSEVVAELREYQRCATTCANAYVQPLMDRYLGRLEAALAARGFRGAFRLMHSAGGLVSPAAARAFPIRLLESGPAGGGLATALFGDLAGHRDVISFDMGGTTAKACLIEHGRAEIAAEMEAGRTHRFKKGSGLPIKAPTIDMIEIGAGGGSIASIDEVGLLRVGPHSAGSAPGPACYGRGGTQPTVTDANLLLGYYDPGFFLGGRMSLDLEAARCAVGALGDKLGLTVEETAHGIQKVVVESMAAAARVHLVEKGKDPRNYAMVGFGGAGPAHAAEVARALGVKEVIVPPASGAASALGFLAAPLSFETVRSHPVEFTAPFDGAALAAVLAQLEAQGRALLLEAGVAPGDVTVERSADMRLVGQMHEITVPLPDGALTPDRVEEIRASFVATYATRYATPPAGARFEAINFRVRCVGPTPTLVLHGAVGGATDAPKRKGTRRAWFAHAWHDTLVLDRYALTPGDAFDGPAIIEEREATTILAPGDRLSVDEALNLRIAVAQTTAAPARITRDTPVQDAMQIIESDPIGLEIMWSRLVTVVEEMWWTVCRTAFSLVISEAQDFACEMLDASGEPLAHSPRAMPVFNLTLPRAVKALLAAYPAETLRPGDVLVTNDPWLCAGHLYDIAVVTPVFHENRLIALMGTVGHVSDIGGARDSMRAREIFDEGLQIPPMKLAERGVPNETLWRLLRENVRNPDQVLGDVQSFLSANALGAERLAAFVREYGMHDLRALAAVVQGRSERAMRDAIRAIPDGTYSAVTVNNPAGEKLSYPLKLTVTGDEIELDFDGAPPQQPRGAINCTLNYTEAHATYPLKCMLTPGVRGNAGCYRPFRVKAPEGSILNARRPAAVNMRTRSGWYLSPSIFRALSDAAPDRVQAFTGLPIAVNIYGLNAEGQPYSDILFTGGGQGASAARDGKSGLLWPTSASNTSIELLESRVPVLIEEKEYTTDSGGPGRFRGGLGQRVKLRKLSDDGLTTLLAIFPESIGVDTPGLFGGHHGGRSSGILRRPDGTMIRDLGVGELLQLSRADEVLDIHVPGGAGFGDPAERSRIAVADDVAAGLVSPGAARKEYGADERALAAAMAPREAAD